MIQPGNARSTTPASSETVMTALKGAADRTGADFGYLLRTAMRESSLNPQASASTSSATGLFQFIEQTWLGTMREHGSAHGLQKYADAIKVGKDGHFSVADPALRQEILALRKDPDTAALMAGELTNDMQQSMQAALGRGVSSGELYIAHFLGPQAAVKLVNAAAESPSTAAATLFPDAAASNRPIFYRKDGTPRTVSAVLENLKSRHEGTSTPATLYAQAPSALAINTTASLLRGTTESGLGLPAVSGNNALDGFGLDGMVMSPLVAQLLASMDPPGFADAFNPDSTEPSRTRKT